MEHRLLGTTGLSVSCLALGSLMFGGPTGPEESDRIIQKAYEIGINFFDTANSYSQGESEKIVGRSLKSIRDKVVLSTKVGRPMGEGPNQQGLSRVNMVKQIEESLRKLDTDWIDLYFLHLEDPCTSMDEITFTLDELVRQGKIRFFGCSNFYPSTIVEGLWSSDRFKRMRFSCVQDEYNLLNRQVEMEILPVCKRYGLGFIAYSPLARGVLTGKYLTHPLRPPFSRADRGDQIILKDLTEEKMGRLERIKAIFSGFNDLGQCAISWLLHQKEVTSVILGPRTIEQLLNNAGAIEIRMEIDVLKALDEFRPVREWGVPPLRNC